LVRLDRGNTVPIQRVGDSNIAVWLLDEPLPVGERRRYRIQEIASDAATRAEVTCVDNGRELLLAIDEQTAVVYNHAVVEPPDSMDTAYRRSGHIHPLRTPSGRVVTDDFAPDHAHQHGVFFAWVNTTFDGRSVDFWNQHKKTGNVEHIAIESTQQGPVFAQFQTRLRHVALADDDASQPVLTETWTVRLYRGDDYFLVDLASRQRCVDKPLTINEYHYGGMGVRGHRQWHASRRRGEVAGEPSFRFTTSEGKHRIEGNHTRPRWVSMSGPVDDGFATLTVMGHPKNFRYPQPVRLHPTMPYFCFAPMVVGAFEITKDNDYVSRYRYLIRDGRLDETLNGRLWHDYAEPPTVRIVK